MSITQRHITEVLTSLLQVLLTLFPKNRSVGHLGGWSAKELLHTYNAIRVKMGARARHVLLLRMGMETGCRTGTGKKTGRFPAPFTRRSGPVHAATVRRSWEVFFDVYCIYLVSDPYCICTRATSSHCIIAAILPLLPLQGTCISECSAFTFTWVFSCI